MPLKKYKKTSPGRRSADIVDTSVLTKKEPEKSLLIPKKRISGRSRNGKITVRHRGGGAKRLYRLIDFKQTKFDIPAKVTALEYDPNRTAWIALLKYPNNEKSYIIAPQGIKVGDEILSSKSKIEAKIGNRMPLKFIPLGSEIHNLELKPGQGGKIVRSAGEKAILMTIEGGYAHVKLPSGEIRLFHEDCMASLGAVSNPDWRYMTWGKAGRRRLKGRRPEVRGKAMAPVSHPHGGGEGHSPIGLKYPKTPWGKPALGVKTRKSKKYSDKFILKRREKKKKK